MILFATKSRVPGIYDAESGCPSRFRASLEAVIRVVVVGGTGLMGNKLINVLTRAGHHPLRASPSTGVNAFTGDGLDEALARADVVVDVSNSPSFENDSVLSYFQTSSANLLAAEIDAGIAHHVALSVVGTERLTESGYFRGKLAQETLIQRSSIPYSIVRATQFFEFLDGIADSATDGKTVLLPPVLIQPVAAADVARVMCEIAAGQPLNGTVEVAGPDQYRLDRLISRLLSDRDDPRVVQPDPDARYFGAHLMERTLLPEAPIALGETRFDEWMDQVVAAHDSRPG